MLRACKMARALAAQGWVAAAVPPTLKRGGRARVIRAFRPDLLIFQQGRLSLNDAGSAFGVPYVLDREDAEFFLTHLPGLSDAPARPVRPPAAGKADALLVRVACEPSPGAAARTDRFLREIRQQSAKYRQADEERAKALGEASAEV
ncbi:hypothetical protein [Paracoccus sp. (in: a-proteobacteria)]|uniref:hypothetical protein n=1 Tax=Paracoccus sp. TaxID=267 RepID=UPI003A84A65F